MPEVASLCYICKSAADDPSRKQRQTANCDRPISLLAGINQQRHVNSNTRLQSLLRQQSENYLHVGLIVGHFGFR